MPNILCSDNRAVRETPADVRLSGTRRAARNAAPTPTVGTYLRLGTVAVLCNASTDASATRTVRASVDVIVRHSGADRYPDPSEALLLSGNVTGSEPAICTCILAAECRSDCVRE